METLTKEQKMQVAINIYNQIGKGAMYMIGAKNFGYDKDSLSFKIGRNQKRVTHIKITLTVWDTYTMEFFNCGKDITLKSKKKNIYNDQLNEMIESETGLITHL